MLADTKMTKHAIIENATETAIEIVTTTHHDPADDATHATIAAAAAAAATKNERASRNASTMSTSASESDENANAAIAIVTASIQVVHDLQNANVALHLQAPTRRPASIPSEKATTIIFCVSSSLIIVYLCTHMLSIAAHITHIQCFYFLLFSLITCMVSYDDNNKKRSLLSTLACSFIHSNTPTHQTRSKHSFSCIKLVETIQQVSSIT